jgi:sulfhydrogenase subunit delta
MSKLRIAIFDLTDCEGCELQLINLREKLALVNEQTEIANWRLASENKNRGPFDVTFIEGSPITDVDIELVKQARANSKLIITLGSCAALGGVQSSINWAKELSNVYGKDYKTKSKPPKPVGYYVNVDLHLPGCPVNTEEIADFISAILINKKPTEARYPVCLECKSNENNCLLLEGQPCLGPITKGGCNAACPDRGLRCWGCFGALRGGNAKALKNLFDKKFGEERTKQLLEIFYSNQNEFKELYAKKYSSTTSAKSKGAK